MNDYQVPIEQIEKFLAGFNDEKYIVGLEYDKKTNLIHKIKDVPGQGKVIETEVLTSFMWIKHLGVLSEKYRFYGNSPALIKKKREEFGITIEYLRHDDNRRLTSGYQLIVTCTQGHARMLDYFKSGGLSPYDRRDGINEHFLILKPVEQFLIGTGKRLFKGMEDYDEVHKMVFDLETTGLDANTNSIFLIGMKDNRGFEYLLEAHDEDSEAKAISDFFRLIDYVKPSIIGGYNSANFDWPFIFKRCEILGIDIQEIAISMKAGELIHNTDGTLKLGGDVEDYSQTNLFGYSIVDFIHSTRRAQAIDSDMKSTSLKYVCKYNKIAKKNRVYVPGDKIGKIFYDAKPYFFDDRTGSFCTSKPTIRTTDWISRDDVQQARESIFLFGDNDLRDGWGGQAKEMRGEPNTVGIRTKKEPEHNEESYYTDAEYDLNVIKIKEDIKTVMGHLKKGKTIVIPSQGFGTGIAELKTRAPKTLHFINGMIEQLKKYCDSFEQVDGKYIVKRYLMDDLWETMEVDNIYNQTGFMLGKIIPTTYQRITTMGTAGLWKLLMMTWSHENNLAIPRPDDKRDFVGGLSRLLKTGYNTRLRKMDYNSLYPAIQLAHDVFPEADISGALKSMLKYFHFERFKAKDLSDKYKKSDPTLSSKYKRKQLPLKIFINSMFGALGAPGAFPWAEINISERVTCCARQYLRLMVRFFMNRGYTALVLDTDGVNFMAPVGGDDHLEYVGKGFHASVVEGKLYKGVKAVIAEFNDLYMKNEMGLGLDGVWPSTINLARKNYAILEEDGEIKKTGNSIKSKKMPVYIEEFLDKGIMLLLHGKGHDFVEYYYAYLEKIYTKQIPLAKIATKAKVKKSLGQYKSRGNNKNGKPLPKQAHMELALATNLQINLGDVLYYVNNGKAASHTDVGTDTKTGVPYSRLIDPKQLEEQPDLLGDYNVAKYVAMFNNRIKPLMVVFDESVRKKIIVKLPEKRGMFMLSELELVNGQPLKDDQQDTLDELFTPSPMEIEHWDQTGYDPCIWFTPEAKFTLPGLGFEREIL